MKLWDSDDTQFCAGCGLYHYRDECTDPYFNDPANWTPQSGSADVPRISAASLTARYRKRYGQ